MQNRNASIIVFIIIAILLIVGIVLAFNRPDGEKGDQNNISPTPTSTSTTTSPGQATFTIPGISGRMIMFTLSEIALHSTSTDCWTAIRGNVYNLTPFVSSHPGGVENITKLCGIDGTSIFTAQHGGMEKQENMLNALKIGELTQ